MSFAIRFNTRAKADIKEAVQWYEDQQAGLGGRFLKALDEITEKIMHRPTSYRVQEYGLRHAKLPHFERYELCYRLEAGCIVVAAIFHSARHPSRLRFREDPPAEPLR